MSYVAVVYTIDRFGQSADDLADEPAKIEPAEGRPDPWHKRMSAEMTQLIDQSCAMAGSRGLENWQSFVTHRLDKNNGETMHTKPHAPHSGRQVTPF